MKDLLSDILMRLRLRGTIYFRTSFAAPWGVTVPSYENVARFHYVQRGDAVIEACGMRVVLEPGDLVIVPHGAEHMLACQETTSDQALALDEMIAQSGYSGDGVFMFGDTQSGRETQLVCGHVALENTGAHPILEKLPPLIHVRDYGAQAGQWLEATLRLIGAETTQNALGSELIALKLSEAIFVQALRVFLTSDSAALAGLDGYSDPQLSRALTAMHKSPEMPWSVETLAREAGMSRTAFAVRFAERIGLPPLQYLTEWRMQLACQALTVGDASIADVAEQVGYASETGFARVFKKEIGASPARYRRRAKKAEMA